MPQRMVDGDAWARSQKLQGVDERWRVHYALWITLAEANGTFECNPALIHKDLYAYQMPGIKPGHVVEMVRQFVAAGVVVTWEANGKTWGTFPGINKAGRLPSKAHLNRYKDLPPLYPGWSGTGPGTCPEGLGLDGIGKERSGLEPGQAPAKQAANVVLTNLGQQEKEADMRLANFVKRCVPIWQEYFGAGAMLRLPTLSKQELEFMTSTYDMDLLLDAFRLYAADQHKFARHDAFAVGKFVSKASEYMLRIKPAIVSTALDEQNEAAAKAFIDEASAALGTPVAAPTNAPLPGGIEEFLKD